ncbi:MAG: hypothetical protein AMS27_09075 [Bacteroides sp. SM23_62_1]|nr:MAG: hypothetical protein AMS27_09075 [Bacteroides sp. SM23_62_1]
MFVYNEHITRIDHNGRMIDYRVYMPLTALTVPVKTSAELTGEIMNVVSIINGNEKNYEGIIRDKQLSSHVLLIKSDGTISEDNVLKRNILSFY